MNVHNQFFLFKLKVQCLGKFGAKIQNCLIKLKFGFNPANISALSQRCSLVDTTLRHRTTSNQRWATWCTSALKFTTLNKFESTFSISTLIFTTLVNVKTTLSFSTSSFTTLSTVETTLWIWPLAKSWKINAELTLYYLVQRKVIQTWANPQVLVADLFSYEGRFVTTRQ